MKFKQVLNENFSWIGINQIQKDNTKKWKVMKYNKVLSRHRELKDAEKAVKKLQKNGMGKTFHIIPVEFDTVTDYNKYRGI